MTEKDPFVEIEMISKEREAEKQAAEERQKRRRNDYFEEDKPTYLEKRFERDKNIDNNNKNIQPIYIIIGLTILLLGIFLIAFFNRPVPSNQSFTCPTINQTCQTCQACGTCTCTPIFQGGNMTCQPIINLNNMTYNVTNSS